MIQLADLFTINYDEILYHQSGVAKYIYFILFGALQVVFNNKDGEVCDIVRGGNVIGEESLFKKAPKCLETVRSISKECVLFRISAHDLIKIQSGNSQ